MKKYHLLIVLAALFLNACGANQTAPESPTAALRQYVEASQKQDVAGMKRLLSRGSLALIEESAQGQGITTEDILRKEAAIMIEKAPVVRNEKIEGDTATVEVQNEKTGEFDIILPFVREDGAWKIARDRYIEHLRKGFPGAGKFPPNTPVSNTNAVKSNTAAENKNAANK